MRTLIRTFCIGALGWLVLAQAGTAQGPPSGVPDAKPLYDKECRKCHGPQGVPPQSMKRLMPALPVMDAAFFAKRTDDAIVNVLKNGKGENMKSYTGKLTAEQMTAVARYIRQLAAGPAAAK
jgi:mono/diheme cytochrome c family protein